MESLQVEQESRPLSESEAEIYVASVCFKTGPPGPVGVEVEHIIHRKNEPALPVPVDRVRAAVASVEGPLPGGGVISFEPGGQLEISSACAPDLAQLVSSTRADLSAVEVLLKEAGLRFGTQAMDAHRPPQRTLDLPRYAAMQRHFDRTGTHGRTMMCSTAALQVSLDAGLDGNGSHSAAARWQHLHSLAPVLVAMFANSPFRSREPSGWRSTRQAMWLATDPTRTAAPPSFSGDPRSDWARYALDALVLCITPPAAGGAAGGAVGAGAAGGAVGVGRAGRAVGRTAGAAPGATTARTGKQAGIQAGKQAAQQSWHAPEELTMRGWLRGGGPRPATQADLDYHLTTLFPPVRPQGFLELRVIDAQAGSDWEVPTAVVTALVEDNRAADLAAEACVRVSALADPMTTAARDGLTNPILAEAARICAGAALDALPRLGADASTVDRTRLFMDRYTLQGLSPADALLDLWRRTGSIAFDESEDPIAAEGQDGGKSNQGPGRNHHDHQ